MMQYIIRLTSCVSTVTQSTFAQSPHHGVCMPIARTRSDTADINFTVHAYDDNSIG